MGKSGNPQIQTAQAGLAAGIPQTAVSAPAPTGRPVAAGTGGLPAGFDISQIRRGIGNMPMTQARGTGQLPAGFDISQIQSGVRNMDMTRASSAAPAAAAPAGPNVFSQAQGYQAQAGQAYGDLAGFQAPTAQAAQIGPVQGVGPVGTLAEADIGQYMSPYTQQVIERGQADIARQREQAMNRLGAQASAAGAFGGSRQGVAEGVTMGEYGRMAGDFAAQQREKAYQQALGAAQYDIGQQQQRAMQDASMRQQAALQQANLQQQAALANQQAALSGAGIQQAGAAGLGALGQQLFGQGMGVQQQIAQQAAFQRSLQQRLLDLQKQQFGQATGAPLSGLGAMSQIMAQTPISRTQTTSQPFNPASLLMLL